MGLTESMLFRIRKETRAEINDAAEKCSTISGEKIIPSMIIRDAVYLWLERFNSDYDFQTERMNNIKAITLHNDNKLMDTLNPQSFLHVMDDAKKQMDLRDLGKYNEELKEG